MDGRSDTLTMTYHNSSSPYLTHLVLSPTLFAFVHNQELVEAKVQRVTDFEWVSRLRYYWRDDVYVDMVQVRDE